MANEQTVAYFQRQFYELFAVLGISKEKCLGNYWV